MAADAVEDVDASPGRGKVHVLAVAHFNVDPVGATGFEFLDRVAQIAVVSPEQSGGDFCLFSDSSYL